MSSKMIEFTKAPTIYLHSGDTNMGKSFKGLTEEVERKLKKKISQDEIFVFFNKARTKVKILFWHLNGFVIVYKALDHDVFELEFKQGMRRIKNIDPGKLLESLNTKDFLRR